jgi:two-component system, chemotaxis family, sensor kinase CheA
MFFEEAGELLAGLKTELSKLEEQDGRPERLNRVYRSVHSLKGAAGMVGLTPINEFALTVERVLGKARSGVLALDSQSASTIRAGCDQLELMIQAEADSKPAPPPADLMDRLLALLNPPAG